MQQEFDAVLIRPPGTGTWTFIRIPFSVQEVFGNKGQVKVKGTVNGVPYQSSAMPQGDGTHYMVVKKEIRDAAGVTEGDMVKVTIEKDLEKRVVAVPDDLRKALTGDESAEAQFAKLSYSHQKEYVQWIEEAKREETRRNRIDKALVMLAEGKKLKG